jgi:hypothetical protein
MRRLSRNVRSTAKNSNLFSATVIDVTGKTATIRMSGTGAIYRDLYYVGGPLTAGDSVKVDFSTDTPMIKAPSTHAPATTQEYEYGISNMDFSSEVVDTGIILEFSDLTREYYSLTYAGWLEAIGDADDWSKIILPECSITAGSAGFGTIPEKVKIVGAGKDITYLRGEITGGPTTFLENLTVWHESEDVEETIAVVGPSSGTMTLNDCFVRGLNCASSGSGYGIRIGAGNVYIYRSQISGEGSGSGAYYGYGIMDDSSGSLYIHDTPVYGDTGQYYSGENVFVHGVTVGIAIGLCS